MIANELRIGNYIMGDRRKPYRFELYDFSDWWNDHNSHEFGDHIKPIPLTEEWLLKFGFDKFKSKNYGIKCGSCWMYLDNPKEMGDWQDCYCWTFDKFKFIELKYVHQLQNLYFALTENELTIKENG